MPTDATDAAVIAALTAEDEVLGYKIRPWTLKQLIKVMPILDQMVADLQSKDIALDGLVQQLDERGTLVMAELLKAVLPALPDFLAISLRSEKAEMEELDLGQAMLIGAKILALNMDHLKNAFNLVLGQTGTR